MFSRICEDVCKHPSEFLDKDYNTVMIITDNQTLTLPMMEATSRELNSVAMADFNGMFIQFNPLQLLCKDLPLVKQTLEKIVLAFQKNNHDRSQTRVLLHFRLPKSFREQSVSVLVDHLNIFVTQLTEAEDKKPCIYATIDTPSTDITMALKKLLNQSTFTVMCDRDDLRIPAPPLHLYLSNYSYGGKPMTLDRPFSLYRMNFK